MLTSFGRCVVTIAGGFLLLASSHAAHAGQEDPNLLCRQAIAASLQRWVPKTVALRQRCLDRSVLGIQSADTDCTRSSSEPDLIAKAARFDELLQRQILFACKDADFPLLSFPGPCPGQPATFDGESLVSCIRNVGGAAIDAMLATQYPPLTDFFRGGEAKCIRGVGGRARGMLLRDLRARLRCLVAQEQGQLAIEVSGAIDCRALPAPHGPGTGSSEFDDAISRGYLAWLTALPPACARVDLEELGYQSPCPPREQEGLDVLDLSRCVFEANVQGSFTLADLVFPTDPVCGNGILQEGEACDNGLANSDTAPDACRTDCAPASCGDSVTDPGSGEACDDGNVSALDGCNGVCQMEFCGDGIVNDSPTEECDDSNQVSTDLCTSACRDAVCGDGFVCTAPACTSGPGAGAEQCDDGVENGPSGACQSDCSGFRFTCQVTVGVTSNELLGGVTYEIEYKDAPGAFLGTGSTVKCTSLITGGLASFFDNETKETVRESVILASGFQAPVSLARCSFATDNAGLATSAFKLTLVDASNPDFEPRTPTLSVTSIVCE